MKTSAQSLRYDEHIVDENIAPDMLCLPHETVDRYRICFGPWERTILVLRLVAIHTRLVSSLLQNLYTMIHLAKDLTVVSSFYHSEVQTKLILGFFGSNLVYPIFLSFASLFQS
jgi:hypothetical protein